jgi:hypothetical protein
VRILRGELEGILAEAVASGELRSMDTKSMAFTLFAFIEAATVHSALYDNISLENTMRDIDLIIDGLRTRSERGGLSAQRTRPAAPSRQRSP